MRETDLTTTHINTFSRVLSKLSSQGINFEEEVKTLALLSILPENWEVFCTIFANNCPKLNLDETIDQVLTKDIWQKSMGITIDDSAEAHNLTESIDPFNRRENKPRERVEILVDQDIGKIDNGRSRRIVNQLSVFCIHCRKTGDDISD